MSRHDLVSKLGLPDEFPAFFPPDIERYRRSLSEATDTPDEFAVAYLLVAGATAVGANVSACVQPGWCVRANVFGAVIGYKGSGKSTLADKVFAPLIQHENELRERAALVVEDLDDGDDGDDDGGHDGNVPNEPCVIANNCTGPAILQLLERNDRQLLVNPDELSAQFIRNTGGTDRQHLCELFDGRRCRRERASGRAKSVTLAAPYLCVLGGIQPDLFRCAYGQRGDDGLLDRLLLFGDGVTRVAAWPRNADDPVLNGRWHDAVTRLLQIEERAEDTIGEQLESRFTPEAVGVCMRLLEHLNHLVAAIGVPESQRGVVKKLIQHAVKLALLHRCFRWAAGEFGENGTLGDIDADDATAACAATLFILGRWLVWRPELAPVGAIPCSEPVGLLQAPGEDPVLKSLAAAAANVQEGLRAIERLVRHLRQHGPGPVSLASLTTAGPLATLPPDELQAACSWLVEHGHARWAQGQAAIGLTPMPAPRPGRRTGATRRAVRA